MRSNFVISVFTLSFVFFTSITLADAQTFNRQVGEPECIVEAKRCSYLTVNVTGNQFVTRVTNQLFPRQSIFFTDESYLEVERGNLVVFWFESEDILKRFKLLIPVIDALESFKPADMVKVTTDILEMTETGLKNFRAQISAVTARPVGNDRDFDVNIGDATTGDLNLNVPLKTVDLSVLLGGASVKKYTRKAITNESYVSNSEDLNFSQTTLVPIEGPSGILEKKTGLEIDGTVSIERDNSDLVKLTNFDLKYSKEVINPVDATQMSINTLDLDRKSLFLYRGLTQTAVKSVSSVQTSDRSGQLNGINRAIGEEYNKLLIMVRAETISHDDIAAEARRIADSNIQGEFSEDQIREFPTDSVELKEIFENIKPFTRFDTTGERIVGFKLDQKYARLENYKKRFDIKIKGGGIKQQANRSLESLMTKGLILNDVSQNYYDRKFIKIKVTIREFIKRPKPGQRRFSKRVTLYYNPQTNEFL